MTTTMKTWLKNVRSFISWEYLIDRMDINFILCSIRQLNFEKYHPFHPWITLDMVRILDNLLKESDIGFEYGSGNSTVWLAKNTKKIYSVETDKGWYEDVLNMLKKFNLEKKVRIFFLDNVDELTFKGKENYVNKIMQFKDNSLDYCFIDGFFRDDCILNSINKLKSGGILIVDNVDTYFPKNKVSFSIRYKRDNFSKVVSRVKMQKIYKILEKWKCIWTTSGIQDTALWIKP